MAQNYVNNKAYEVVELADQYGNLINTIGAGSSTGTLSLQNFDSFNRLRTSNPWTVGDYKHIYGINPEFLNVLSGTGATITFNQYQSSVSIVSGTGTTGYAIHQTQRYHNYMPGKSHLILSSFVFGAANPNVTKRTGYFDSQSGVFVEQDASGNLNFVIRNYINGSVSERRVPQSQWNVDKCDGTGASGFNLDVTKSQLAYFSFQWLGVGAVHCGFEYNGNFIIAHNFYNSNNIATVYFTYPNLPIRCEVSNSGAISTGNSMVQICGTVISEGGYADPGYDYSAMSGVITVGVGATAPIMAIRSASNFSGLPNRIATRLTSTSVMSTATNIKYKVYRVPSNSYVVGGGWTSAGSNSGVEYNPNPSSFTPGDLVLSGFSAAAIVGQGVGNVAPVSSAGGQDVAGASKKNFISTNYDCTDSSIYILVAENMSSGSTTTVAASMNWREVY